MTNAKYIPEMTQDEAIPDPATLKARFHNVYDHLVDLTDDYAVAHNRQARERLSDLLELCEYLRGEDQDDPLEKWFPK